MSTPDFFRSRLDAMVDPRHPLAVLASRLDWEQIESRIAPLFARNGQRQAVEGADLFGPTPRTVGVHPGGRPRLPFRLMLSLLYLKHAYGESDESVCERWSENVVWQFFSGMDYYRPKLPCDATQIGRFRRELPTSSDWPVMKANRGYRPMHILFIGKRFNTNRDALLEKYGRNYQFPLHLAQRHSVELWLVDYHSKTTIQCSDGPLAVTSTPVKNLAVLKHYLLGNYQTTQPIDMVIASGDCYIALMAQRVAKKLKAKFVFDVYDKYDEFSGYVKPLGFDLFGYLLKKADMRLFASHALLHSLGQPERDAILSNGLDATHFRPIDKAEARRKLQLPADTTYVGYFGSMEPDRGVQDLIAAVQILREQGQSIELLLGGKAHDSLQLDQPGIRYLGNVPFANVPYALAASDVLAIPHRRSAFLDAAAPNKVGEALVMQRPIVATRSPNLIANFQQQAQELDPYLAEPSQPASLAAALAQQLLDRKLVAAPQNIYWSGITSTLEQDLKRLTHDPA